MSGPEPAPLPAGRSAGDLITSWRPSPVSPRAADFARAVVTGAAPGGRERARNLLQSAGKLADYAIGCGLEPVPEVLFHSWVTERFAVSAPGLSGVARRTLRTNLRFLARRVECVRYFVRGIFPARYRMFIRYPFFALSDVLVPVLFSGSGKSGFPCCSGADAACPGYLAVLLIPGAAA